MIEHEAQLDLHLEKSRKSILLHNSNFEVYEGKADILEIQIK